MERDAGAREACSDRQVKAGAGKRRRAIREARVAPDTIEGLLEYFLDTDARELEFEISRLRQRLTKEFFDHIKLELGQLRFAVNRTQEMEDRMIVLEAIQKVLLEGTEAYDKMEKDLVSTKEKLMRILQSKDKKTTLLDMVEQNELNRSVLALLDENIASAIENNQKEAAAYMESVRATMLKYITV
ncbi:uncharacterized protein A4U43_C10F1640 [Asparagus officinalis]|uniref:Uncharacterized protein n=2 Tax=Asparagus officinalis TaxID=4686 RepID=A0A5P1E1M3_ASPOF|nr:uncharacterized protein A4U43_C10F1640 [Asparagus officinalis]